MPPVDIDRRPMRRANPGSQNSQNPGVERHIKFGPGGHDDGQIGAQGVNVSSSGLYVLLGTKQRRERNRDVVSFSAQSILAASLFPSLAGAVDPACRLGGGR
jgi:hypothetical protein